MLFPIQSSNDPAGIRDKIKSETEKISSTLTEFKDSIEHDFNKAMKTIAKKLNEIAKDFEVKIEAYNVVYYSRMEHEKENEKNQERKKFFFYIQHTIFFVSLLHFISFPQGRLL